MTDKHIPASKLLALITTEPAKNEWGDTIQGCYDEKVDVLALRALIDEAPEVEPVEYQIKILGERWTHCAKHLYDPANPNTRALYTSPPPSTDLTKLVGELVEAMIDLRKHVNAEEFDYAYGELLTRAKEYLK